jgi:hypothetical protein
LRSLSGGKHGGEEEEEKRGEEENWSGRAVPRKLAGAEWMTV